VFRRRRRGTSSRARSSRKTRWTAGIWQGKQVSFQGDVAGIGSGHYTWVSFWMKWPAGHFAPQYAGTPEPSARLEPSDETLVRSLVQFSALGTWNSNVYARQVWEVAAGLIAWDGGEMPNFFDLATFDGQNSLVAPPNPIVDADDDWIIRDTWGLNAVNLVQMSTATDTYINSRAKRKLPPDTGVLAVVGVANTIDDDNALLQLDFTFDARMAIRSGYTA